MSKFFLVVLVFLLVFNPRKLPVLVKHLSKMYVKYNAHKLKFREYWQENIQKEVQVQHLEENLKKAYEADALYEKKDELCSSKNKPNH
jgi:Sec-independent protein translocase protein TatA